MTDDSEEFGPWIEHDGVTWPPAPLGTVVHRVFSEPVGQGDAVGCLEHTDALLPTEENNWRWKESRWKTAVPIIRYRIRKPRALRQLREMVENLPAPSKQPETEMT